MEKIAEEVYGNAIERKTLDKTNNKDGRYVEELLGKSYN